MTFRDVLTFNKEFLESCDYISWAWLKISVPITSATTILREGEKYITSANSYRTTSNAPDKNCMKTKKLKRIIALKQLCQVQNNSKLDQT